MTLYQAAAVARCSHETVKKWCQSGRLKARRLPNEDAGRYEWVIRPADLRRFLARPKTETRGRPRGKTLKTSNQER